MSHHDTIKQRDSVYGDYSAVATTAARLRQTIYTRIRATGRHVTPEETETINMVCTKLARIACAPGWTPEIIDALIDSYHDIGGYTALTEAQLRRIKVRLQSEKADREAKTQAPPPITGLGRAASPAPRTVGIGTAVFTDKDGTPYSRDDIEHMRKAYKLPATATDATVVARHHGEVGRQNAVD